jgi:hypothetical protein
VALICLGAFRGAISERTPLPDQVLYLAVEERYDSWSR